MPDQTKIEVKPVKFIHEKGAQYRVYHVDSAWAAINTGGNLKIDFCVEHPPIPSHVVQPVNPDGSPKGEHMLYGLEDKVHFTIVRDFQCGVVLSFAAAIQIQAILANYIKAAKQQMDVAVSQIKPNQ